MKIITTPNAAASQTEHPWRATARTLVQSILGALAALGLIFLLVPGAMDELAGALGELGIVIPAVWIALPPVIARIMAIPGVEAALRKISLGAAPAEMVRVDPSQIPGDWAGADSDDVDYEPEH
ncbi:hypothetical protein [Brevibacterium otitidis]|uniref:Uncharacterized protein n=1 Tax=Brevibacterium otitidis TaxID=53364 RepID=A0ABV5X1M7_9MICO|nr:hypothetical protein GCM10023233_22550 [Brevibacterium otitidis]